MKLMIRPSVWLEGQADGRFILPTRSRRTGGSRCTLMAKLLSAMFSSKMIECSMDGMTLSGPGNGIWDDGEWVSWAYINGQLENAPEGELLEELIVAAKSYFDETGRHLPIYGELGELYVERRYGIERHDPHTQGSDGRIGNTLVEIKTISPMKGCHEVRVKRSGNFGVLAVVKIDADFRINAKLIKRSRLPKGTGKYITVAWDTYTSDHHEY